MPIARVLTVLLLGLTVGVGTGSLVAQTGTIEGRVVSRYDALPLAQAVVQVRSGTTGIAGALTSADGSYSVTVPVGVYSVSVASIGYAPSRQDGVTVTAGGSTTVDFTVGAVELNPIIVAVSRVDEKALGAPASVTAIMAPDIVSRPSLTVTDHLKAVPGVDIIQGGLIQANLVGRGFNGIFSGSLQTLTDNRYANLPSLRANLPGFYPGIDEDIERVEFILGPGAALYGPNTADGVLAIFSRSPFSSEGNTLSLTSGFRAGSRSAEGASLDDGHVLGGGSFRHAKVLGSKFGYKISGYYQAGRDWLSSDPAEPDALPGRTCTSGYGCRDFDQQRWGLDFRMDYRLDGATEFIGEYGRTTWLHSIDYTGVGAAQVDNWTYDFFQLRARHKRLFSQVFWNRSDSGIDDPSQPVGTFLLRDGSALYDRSRVLAAQVQHGTLLTDRLDAVYGVDFTYTDPRTAGTINGRNEADDDIREVGGYVHATYRLSDRVNLVGALRVDDNSRLVKASVSPRAAVVFSPNENHSFRVTYNRAFATPDNLQSFLDLVGGQAGPYTVRVLGVPASGFNFRGYCGQGGVDNLCMWPGPFPGVPNQAIPANAALLWGLAAGAVAAQLPAAVGQILAAIPAPTTVGTQLRRLDPTAGAFYDVNPSQITDIHALTPTINNVFEVGYKGIVNERFRASVDVWYERKHDFIGDIAVETPNVFLDPATTLAYLQSTLLPILNANSVPGADVITQQVAAGMAGISGNAVVTGVPLGTVVPNSSLTQGPDIVLTYRNFGEVDLFGADIALDYWFDNRWSASINYSWVSDDFFSAAEVMGSGPIALNASRGKGAVTLRYTSFRDELRAEARGRYVKGFPVVSGVYVSATLPDGSLKPIGGYGLVDLLFSWKLPFDQRIRASLDIQNVLDKTYATFIGFPQLGRLALAKVSVNF